MEKPPKKNPYKKILAFSGMGLEMGVTIYLGNYFGAWLDEKYELTYLETTLTMLAVVIAMYSVIKRANNLNK